MAQLAISFSCISSLWDDADRRWVEWMQSDQPYEYYKMRIATEHLYWTTIWKCIFIDSLISQHYTYLCICMYTNIFILLLHMYNICVCVCMGVLT